MLLTYCNKNLVKTKYLITCVRQRTFKQQKSSHNQMIVNLIMENMMMISRLAIPGLLMLSLLTLSACDTPIAGENKTKIEADLSSKSQVPPVVTKDAEGEVEVMIDKKNNKLTWKIEYENLTGAVTGAHFHGPATISESAGVALPINGDLTSPIKGEATLTAEQMTEVLAGKWYVNLHTAANPDGEIRGQLMPKS